MATRTGLLAELQTRLGLASLEPDDTGLYSLMVDGNLPVFLQFTAEDEGVLLFAGLGSLDAEDAAAACQALLESNHFWLQTGGFTLSLIPGTLNVLLTGRERLAGLDDAGLFDLFDRFVTAADAWKQRLPSIAAQSPGAEVRRMMALAEAEGEGEAARPEPQPLRRPFPGDLA